MILPFAAVALEAFTVVPVITIVGQGEAVTLKLLELVQPLLSFALILYDPAANPVKLPLPRKAPPFILKVKPVLPVAAAFILPLVELPPDVGVVVAVTTIVLPAQGSAAALSGLLHEVKFITRNEILIKLKSSKIFFLMKVF